LSSCFSEYQIRLNFRGNTLSFFWYRGTSIKETKFGTYAGTRIAEQANPVPVSWVIDRRRCGAP